MSRLGSIVHDATRLSSGGVVRRLERGWRRLRASGRTFRPVFVSGMMGSGTTLVALSMAQNFRVAGVATESALQLSRRSTLHMERTDRYPNLDAYWRALHEPRRFRAGHERRMLSNLYRGMARHPGEHIVDKAPNSHMTRAPWLAELFPGAHLVIVFRDPRSNVEGLRRKWRVCGEATLDENIRFYADLHRTLLDSERSLDLRVTYIEYERFVTENAAELERLRTIVGVASAMNTIPLTNRPNVPGRSIRNVGERAIELVRGTTSESLERLDRDAAATILRELGPLHELLRSRATAGSAAS